MRVASLPKTVLSGLTSGVILGLFLKLMEYLTGKKVYILLLNVDYVPLLKDYNTTELFEFVLHLVISILLALALRIFLLKNMTMKDARRFVLWISSMIGVILYPTTMFSDRTPEFTDLYAFLIWMAGHVLYGWVLGFFLAEQET